MEWKKGDFIIFDDPKLLDVVMIHNMLSNSYWAKGRTIEEVKETIKNSLNFGVYHQKRQIGFARVVTDKVVFSWVMDVIIDEDYRARGLGKWLVTCILEHPDVKETSVRLATKDAHSLYEKFGFKKAEMLKREKSM